MTGRKPHPGLKAAAVLIACLVAATVWAKEPMTFFGLAFPDEIAGARAGSPHDYETDHPGLGYSVQYLRQGWKIDVYVYDARIAGIPDDPQSEIVKLHFEQAIGDIFQLQRSGGYDNVAVKRKYTIGQDADRRVGFLCATISLVRKGFGDSDSFLCLTSWRAKFVKFRLTTPAHEGSEAEATGFVSAWRKILWPST